MIPNHWYIVLDSSQVKRDPVGVTRMGEKLVQGDRPIVEYRKRWHEWMEDAKGIR